MGMKELLLLCLAAVLSVSCVTTPKTDQASIDSGPLLIRPTENGQLGITNNTPRNHVRISASFLGKSTELGTADAGGTLLFSPPWKGSSYTYSLVAEDGQLLGSAEYASLAKSSRTRISSLETRAYRILQADLRDSEQRTSFLHGVKIVIAYLPDAVKALTPSSKEAFERQCLNSFHRIYLLFGDFPLTEYRIIVTDTIPTIESLPGCTVTLRLAGLIPEEELQNRILSNEELSHQIGHAWIGGAIWVENHSVDGWIIEGLDHFVGIAALDTCNAFFSRDWKDRRYLAHTGDPLSEMYQAYRGTYDSYSYYAKGSLFTGLVLTQLAQAGVDSAVFFRYLYKKYATVSPSNSDGEKTLISTASFRNDLGQFPDFDARQYYDPYVFGHSVLPPEAVSPRISELMPAWE